MLLLMFLHRLYFQLQIYTSSDKIVAVEMLPNIVIKVLYCTCLSMQGFSEWLVWLILMQVTINLHHRVPTDLTSKSCVLPLEYIGICYLCHVKVPDMHECFKSCLLCELHLILDKLKQEKCVVSWHSCG